MLRFALMEDDRKKIVSALAQVEARSAICRLRKDKFITLDEAAIAVSSLTREIRRLLEHPVSNRVLETAGSLVERYSLRALDAVQLGTAVVARDIFESQEMRFIASDKALLVAAQREGFQTWDPVLTGV